MGITANLDSQFGMGHSRRRVLVGMSASPQRPDLFDDGRLTCPLATRWRRLDCRSRGVNDDVEALVGSRRDEIAREQIVGRFADLVRVLAIRIALPEPLPADRVRNIKVMKLVGHVSLRDQRTHPLAIGDGVCREIENDRKALPQDIDDVRPHRGAQPRGKNCEVVDCSAPRQETDATSSDPD